MQTVNVPAIVDRKLAAVKAEQLMGLMDQVDKFDGF